jgi:hypothetical protein
MIEANSILRRLPEGLDRKQALFLDGIRHASEITAFAYARLQRMLTQIAVTEKVDEQRRDCYTSAFLDAWTVVDAIDRFRSLWSLIPRAFGAAQSTQNEPHNKPTFAEMTQPIRNLRNVADHLAQRVDYVIANKGTALGVLSWFTMTKQEPLEGLVCTLMPGTLQATTAQMVNPAGQEIEMPTGVIHLAAGEHRASLSSVIPEMVVRIRDLEMQLERYIAKLDPAPKRAAADALMKMAVKF